MKVVITDEALSDLRSITQFIKGENPQRALSFAVELRDACRKLGAAPYAFAALINDPDSRIRRRPYGNYLIFYRVTTEVQILHILHGAQDHEKILFPED
ncbi:MAG: type II toxin-antitoxin system RelE/ParE family toxin [Pseudorhizobium pelagicum]|uniref:type II toxin-antitoxin system RelE/ParE family toxin n=1 Tax=Pseudorhizobium pelagicum TaxID=1509405 RepID=UPI0034617294